MADTAADMLRASINALPEHLRTPWEYRITSLYMNGTSYGPVIAIPHTGPSVVSTVSGTIGEHIALTASPDVATALADLLDAETACREATAAIKAIEQGTPMENIATIADAAAQADIRRRDAFDTLEQAITRNRA